VSILIRPWLCVVEPAHNSVPWPIFWLLLDLRAARVGEQRCQCALVLLSSCSLSSSADANNSSNNIMN
jgi:hypothetical protein